MTAAVVAAGGSESESAEPTRIEVELVDGRARVRTLAHGGLVAARPLRKRGARVSIALVGIRMALLGGDELCLHIRVGAGVTLELVETTGMVAYDANGQRSSWHASITVERDASLIWHGEPFVAARGSNAHRVTDISLAENAKALLWETLVLGRSGEHEVCLRNRADITHRGEPLLSEDMVIDDQTRHLPGLVAPSRAIATLTAAGWRPEGETSDPHRLDLAGEGALYRALEPDAHRAEDQLQPVFDSWRAELLARD